MIEQNAVAGVDVVGFSVVDNDPVGVKFCDTCNKDQVDSIKQVLRFMTFSDKKLLNGGYKMIIHVQSENRR